MYYWEYVEMIFAEKYSWRNIDDMGLSERRRKMTFIEALAEGQRAKAAKAQSKAG